MGILAKPFLPSCSFPGHWRRDVEPASLCPHLHRASLFSPRHGSRWLWRPQVIGIVTWSQQPEKLGDILSRWDHAKVQEGRRRE